MLWVAIWHKCFDSHSSFTRSDQYIIKQNSTSKISSLTRITIDHRVKTGRRSFGTSVDGSFVFGGGGRGGFGGLEEDVGVDE